jgi:hypothetical protein
VGPAGAGGVPTDSALCMPRRVPALVGCFTGEAAGELLGFFFALGFGLGLGGCCFGGRGRVDDGLFEREERLGRTCGRHGSHLCRKRARPARGRALGDSCGDLLGSAGGAVVFVRVVRFEDGGLCLGDELEVAVLRHGPREGKAVDGVDFAAGVGVVVAHEHGPGGDLVAGLAALRRLGTLEEYAAPVTNLAIILLRK